MKPFEVGNIIGERETDFRAEIKAMVKLPEPYPTNRYILTVELIEEEPKGGWEYRCVHGHDRCAEMYPGPECPYCERIGG